jgi:predicted amidohydrolase
MMRAALCQIPCALGDKEENLSRMGRMLAQREADLYIFPEMFLTGYMVRDEVFRLAEDVDGPSVSAVERMSAEVGAPILFGMAAWDDELPGVLRNSAVMVSPDGSVQRYDKVNLANFGPFEEGIYFTPGGAPAPMEVNGRRVGVVICYDLSFPELSKWYTLQGSEAIVCLSASPVTSLPLFERLVPARAAENASYCLYVNQTGTQLNQVFFGGAEASGPGGERLAKAAYFTEDVKVIELDPEAVRSARRARPTLRDSLRSAVGVEGHVQHIPTPLNDRKR